MATQQISSENIAEIEKHKYFLSEKAGYDVGWDAAEQDWLSNHADHVNSSTPTISKAPGVGKFLTQGGDDELGAFASRGQGFELLLIGHGWVVPVWLEAKG